MGLKVTMDKSVPKNPARGTASYDFYWKFLDGIAYGRALRGLGHEDSGRAYHRRTVEIVVMESLADARQRLGAAELEAFGKLDLMGKVRYCLKNPMVGKFFRKAILNNIPAITYPVDRHEEADKLAVLCLMGRRNIRFLDVGSGFDINLAPTTHRTVELFSRFGFEVAATAIDLRIPSELHGKSLGNVTYLSMDIFDPKVAEKLAEEFDYIRCGHLLYHFKEEKRATALEILSYFLRNDGVLMENPHPDSFFALYRKEEGSLLRMERPMKIPAV
jgi:hypothetical protein